MTQPTALRLADDLTKYLGGNTATQAAAELRRLHAELERCKQVCSATSESWRTDAESWKAQRDALLEALKEMLGVWEEDPAYGHASAEKARAAIKAVEEGK